MTRAQHTRGHDEACPSIGRLVPVSMTSDGGRRSVGAASVQSHVRHEACHCLAPAPRLPILPLAAAVLVVLLMSAQAFPAVVRLFFCAPSAWLSAQFLGVEVFPLADGFRLDCPQLPVDVSLACSGTTFFAMLLVLLTVHELGQAHGGPRARAHRRATLFGAGSLLILSYVATLAANTARIVLGWHAAVWAHAALPPSFHSGVHLIVGVIVFSGFLAAVVLATRLNPAPRLTPRVAQCEVEVPFDLFASAGLSPSNFPREIPVPTTVPLVAHCQADGDIRPTLGISTTRN